MWMILKGILVNKPGTVKCTCNRARETALSRPTGPYLCYRVGNTGYTGSSSDKPDVGVALKVVARKVAQDTCNRQLLLSIWVSTQERGQRASE